MKTDIQIGFDSYHISSNANDLAKPIQYGSSPMLINGKTYVPAQLFNLLFSNPETITIDNGVMSIVTK